MTDKLGIGVGVVSTDTPQERTNTFSPLDFAYWCSTFISTGLVSDYSDNGIDNDNAKLISWSAQQVGLIYMPNTIDEIKTFCANSYVTIAEALTKRGALLISDTDIAITLGLNDFIYCVNGRHFIKKMTSLDLQYWAYGALVPGLDYR